MKIPSERWEIIAGFTGYEISTHGRVRTYRPANGRGPLLTEPREVRPRSIKGKPYLRVTLSDNHNRQLTKKVHILVLETFVSPRPSTIHDGCHNNGNAKDNVLENLRWDTKKGNAQDRIIHGTQPRGTDVGISVLTENQVREIKNAIPKWKRGFTSDFARKFGVARATIDAIRNGTTWRHV